MQLTLILVFTLGLGVPQGPNLLARAEPELEKLIATVKMQQEQIETLQKQLAKLSQEFKQFRESHKELLGRWSLVAVEEDGKRRAPERAMEWEFGINIVTVWEGEKAIATMSCKLRPFESPKEIDMQMKDMKAPLLGIYALDGDQLVVCNTSPDQPRPLAFRSDGVAKVWFFKKVK